MLRKGTLDRALDRAAAGPGFQQTLDMLQELDINLLPRNGFEDAPLCRMPNAAAIPSGRVSDSGSPKAPTPGGVAEDPEVRPMPTSSQPSLLGSCAIRSPFEDCNWSQPRHCQRHISAMGSPGTSIPKHALKQSAPRTLATQPWLCCGFAPIS